jgi:long-chain acyl-CoA synthetase
MFTTFMAVGEAVAGFRLAGKPVPLSWRLRYLVGEFFLFSALKDRLGLSRLRSAMTCGAALGPEAFRFFHAIGVDLRQLYGVTETSGISCMHVTGDVNGESVGRPLPGTEIRIDETGEILVRGEGVFPGYYGDVEATAAALRDGWFHSGDAGRLTGEGHLVVIDRIHDLLTLPDGTRFARQLIESRLTFSPYIRNALVIERDSAPLAALIGIDGRVAGTWASDNRLSFAGFADLASRPELIGLVEQELARINESLPAGARIHRFALLYKELDADEGELTRTGTVRRSMVECRYGDLIAALRSGVESVPVDTTIEFPDGKSGHIRTTVTIRNL